MPRPHNNFGSSLVVSPFFLEGGLGTPVIVGDCAEILGWSSLGIRAA